MAPSHEPMMIKVTPVTLPRGSSIQRDSPREPKQRQPDYDEKFDFETLFYDVFRCGHVVRAVGPPLMNLEPVLSASLASLDRPIELKTHQLDRVQRTVFKGLARNASTLDFSLDTARFTAEIGADLAPLFSKCKVLLTMSKDNELDWIREWVQFHVRYHAVDAVIIYDNGSTTYPLTDLQSTLANVSGVKCSAIIPWPFKYGPQAGPDQVWDSDYCQYGALEHARWRLLRDAHGVINADIDELVLTPPGTSVFDYVRSSGTGLVEYPGKWIEAVPYGSESKSFYSGFGYTSSLEPECPNKWCLVPSRIPTRVQWSVHEVKWSKSWRRPWELVWRHRHRLHPVSYRHFKAINTGWKYPRLHAHFNADIHQLDAQLREALFHVDM